MLVEQSTDRVSHELQPRAARNADLGGPRSTIRLTRIRTDGRRGRLEVAGKGVSVYVGSDHGGCAVHQYQIAATFSTTPRIQPTTYPFRSSSQLSLRHEMGRQST